MKRLFKNVLYDIEGKKCISYALICLIIIAGGGIGACSSGKPALSPMFQGTGPLPKGGGRVHVGKPYKIAGQWYYPSANEHYDRVGIASWYGDKFHRRMTSNGEWFDMNTLSAAHPTMKLPSYAQVVNLENGRRIIVRVNDRGPFVANRLIDLSKRAAKELGFYGKGTAKVRVTRIGDAVLHDDGRHLMALNGRIKREGDGIGDGIVASSPIRVASNPDRVSPSPVVVAQTPQMQSPKSEHLFVQAASFSHQSNAVRAQQKLSSIATTKIHSAIVNGNKFYRVRLGPFNSEDAPQALERVRIAGLTGAQIVRN